MYDVSVSMCRAECLEAGMVVLLAGGRVRRIASNDGFFGGEIRVRTEAADGASRRLSNCFLRPDASVSVLSIAPAV